jgi:hypothetical protein
MNVDMGLPHACFTGCASTNQAFSDQETCMYVGLPFHWLPVCDLDTDSGRVVNRELGDSIKCCWKYVAQIGLKFMILLP